MNINFIVYLYDCKSLVERERLTGAKQDSFHFISKKKLLRDSK